VIKGVNLGNWLVLEKWMSPGLFAGTEAEDETQLSCDLADVTERLTAHRDSYITERDFAYLGRWQARYKGPDGIDRPAPRTFESKTSAERWLSLTEAEIIQGDWIDPDAGRVLFGAYARDWIEERPGLRPKTVELYRYLLRQHLEPAFASRALADIKEPHVRRWRKNLLDVG
jgi:hypothetical protein